MKYRPDVDGLRAVAVVLVVLFHAKLGFPGGYVGVDVFFVISGYLITSLIERDLNAGVFSLAAFWDRRIRRIVPAVTVNVIVTVIIGWLLLLPADVNDLAKSAIAQPLMCANIYFWKSTGYFDGPAEMKPLLHMWSLAVEEQFYLLFPPIFLVLRSRLRKHSILFLSSIAVCSLVVCEIGLAWRPAAAYFLLPTRAWELLAGCLLALKTDCFPRHRLFKELSGMMGLLLIVASGLLLSRTSRFPGLAAVPSCLGTVLVIASGRFEDTKVFRVLATKPFVAIGLVSYSLYLWHWPVLVFTEYWGLGFIQWPVRVVVVVLSVGLAVVSTRWIESPFRGNRWMRAIPSLATFSVCGLSVLTILFLGSLLVANPTSPLLSAKALRFVTAVDQNRFNAECLLADVVQRSLPTIGEVSPGILFDVVLWGDSHAMSAGPAIESACLNLKMNGVMAAHSGTPPLLNFVSGNIHGLRQGNLEFSDAVVAMAREASSRAVIMVALWSHYYHEDIQSFENSLATTLATLSNQGIRVIVLLEVPKQPCDVPRALARAEIFSQGPENVGVAVVDHRERTRLVNSVIRKIAANYPLVTVLDPEACFCNERGFCAALADGEVVYRDSHHLTTRGALRMAGIIEEALRQMAAPSSDTHQLLR